MTTQIVRPARITIPPITARPGELLDIATVHEGLEWLDPTDMAESFNCVNTGAVTTFPCPTPPATKVFDRASTWIDGIRFVVYTGYLCKGPGFLMSEAESNLQTVFTAQESVGVEQAVMTSILSEAGATDLTPAAGAVSPAVGLALLEGHAATKYAGVPTIHAPRSIGSLLAGTGAGITLEGSKFYTKQGSKLASGGGYELPANASPAGAAPAVGELWMYATGEVVLARSDTIFQSGLNQTTNDQIALLERMYVAAVDCYRAGVRVKVQ